MKISSHFRKRLLFSLLIHGYILLSEGFFPAQSCCMLKEVCASALIKVMYELMRSLQSMWSKRKSLTSSAVPSTYHKLVSCNQKVDWICVKCCSRRLIIASQVDACSINVLFSKYLEAEWIGGRGGVKRFETSHTEILRWKMLQAYKVLFSGFFKKTTFFFSFLCCFPD